jgi:hypothetical protein
MSSLELRPTVISRILLAAPAALVALVASAVWMPLAAAPIAGYALACVAIARRRVWIDGDGVRWRRISGLGGGALRWDEIERYRYWASVIKKPLGLTSIPAVVRELAAGPTPGPIVGGADTTVRNTRHHMVLVGAGVTFRFGSEMHDADRAAAIVLAEIHPRLRARGAPGSGASELRPFTVEEAGLRHASAGLLSWADLEKVALTEELPPRVRVMKRRKALAWVSERLDRVDDGMLLLEELAARGVPVTRGRTTVVTAPVAGAEAVAAALPRAVARTRD